MAKRREKKTQTKLQDLVVITTAHDMDQAKDYEVLLKNNDIPAMVKEQIEDDTVQIVVLVPEDYVDEAHVVIESQDAYDDFYDLETDADGEDFLSLDSDLFEDDF